MPRYVVERTFPDRLVIPTTEEGAQGLAPVIATNLEDGVTWLHSYVSRDKHHTWGLYEAPDEEAIRKVAARNGLPVNGITEVTVLDPYFYR